MKWPASISIKQIALAFLTGLLVLLSLIGGFAAYQTRSVSEKLEQHSRDAARSELAAAVERLVRQTERQASALANWDETRQQLVLPEYYTYWRDQRVYESGQLNRHFARIGLYNRSGKPLAPNPKGSRMPASLPGDVSTQAPSSWLVDEGGSSALYYKFPVHGDAQRQALLGHGLIRIDFMPALLGQESLHFTERSNAVVVQGATGRWCEVLSFCAECCPRPGIVYTLEEARERAAGIGGTVDF